MKKLSFLMALLAITVSSFSQMVNPIRWTHTTSVEGDVLELKATATIDEGWHLYALELPPLGPAPTTFSFYELSGIETINKVEGITKLINKYEPIFEAELSWYENSAQFIQKFKITDKKYTFEGEITFMGCNDASCIMGEPYRFKIEGVSKVKNVEKETDEVKTNEVENRVIDAPIVEETVSHEDSKTEEIAEVTPANEETEQEAKTGYLGIFILGFLGGIVALITPCVWPIIPMTVSFFLKGNKNKNKAIADAFTYGVSIVVIYLILGIAVTLIFGASALNELSTSAVFNIIFFLMLVVFAVSFFGAFEIKLPASWTSKMDAKADSTTGIISIMFMAFTLVLVSFSCTGPIIGTLLVEAASGQSLLGPILGMFGFALALAIPFTVFAMFPSMLKSMPKSGGWLNSVKVVLGFLELALALKFLSVADLAYGWGILDREVFVSLWIIIFALLGLYLIGKLRLPHDDKVEKVSVIRLMLAIVAFAYAIYLVPGLWGAPLKSASAFAPPLSTQDFNLLEVATKADLDNLSISAGTGKSTRKIELKDYDEALAVAKQENRPIFVDFTGHGCVNCRKMHDAVFADKNVKDKLYQNFIFVSLYVDERKKLDEPIIVNENGVEKELRTVGEKNSYLQRTLFQSNSQPYYMTLDEEGNHLNTSYSYDENIPKFIQYLETSLDKYNKK